jgi:hypothetical protein
LGFTNWPVILLHQQTPSSFLAPSSPRHQEAWESANAAKVSAEKATKSAEIKAKELKRLWQSPNKSRPSGSSP